jgi:undecaprenyl-diphosphatase
MTLRGHHASAPHVHPHTFGPSPVAPTVLSIAAGVAAYLSVRFLSRYFTHRTLMPFAVYSLVAGALALIWFGL